MVSLILTLLHLVQILQEQERVLVAIMSACEDISSDSCCATDLMLLVPEEDRHGAVLEVNCVLKPLLAFLFIKALILMVATARGVKLRDLFLADELIIGVEVDLALSLTDSDLLHVNGLFKQFSKSDEGCRPYCGASTLAIPGDAQIEVLFLLAQVVLFVWIVKVS